MFIAGQKKTLLFFLQERRGRSSPWVPSLRRHRDHHHERVPQVQVRSPSMSRLLRSHTPGMTRAKKSHILNDVTHNLFQRGVNHFSAKQ